MTGRHRRALAGHTGVVVWWVGVAVLVAAAWRVVDGGFAGRIAWGGAMAATIGHALVAWGAAPRARAAIRVGAGIAMVALACASPLFSDDVWRYVADGHVSSAGLNPWAWPPSSPKIRDVVGPWLASINHPELPTIYPPVAQGVFAVLATAGAGVVGFRLAAVAAWFAASQLAERLRPATDETAGAGWWMSTHPLALISVGANGHVDAFGVLALVAALTLWRRRRDVGGAVMIALAAGIKLFPIGVVVALLGRRSLRRVAGVGALASVVLAATWLPVVVSGGPALGSLGRYAAAWTFNAGPAAVVQHVADAGMGAAGVPASVELEPVSRWRAARGITTVYDGVPTHAAWYGRNELARAATRGVALGVLLAVAAYVRRRQIDVVTATTWLLVALFATSPVVHPWYLLWVLAPAAIAQRPAALAWCASVMLAFGAAARSVDGGPWTDPLWSRWIQYAIPALVASAAMRSTGCNATASCDNGPSRDTVEGVSSDRPRRV